MEPFPQFIMAGDMFHLRDADPVRRIHCGPVGKRVEVEVLAVDVDSLLLNQRPERMEDVVQRLRIAEIQQKDVAVTAGRQPLREPRQRECTCSGSNQARNFIPAFRAASLTGLSPFGCGTELISQLPTRTGQSERPSFFCSSSSRKWGQGPG